MRNTSEIFDEYAKIAIAQGLVSTAEDDDKKESKDSLSDDAVRLLYGIEPESIYKGDSILEDAHPDTAVVGRSYDAMNAVIENLQQRQDVMSYIALRNPDGHLTHRRYVQARADLLNSLVRAGFMLDSRDETKMMVLADSCASRLSNQPIVKEANPLLYWGIAAAVAGIGALYYHFAYSGFSVQNVHNNAQIVKMCAQPLKSEPYGEAIIQSMDAIIPAAKEAEKCRAELDALCANLNINPGKIANKNQGEIQKAVETLSNSPGEAVKIKLLKNKMTAWIGTLEGLKKDIPVWANLIQNSPDPEKRATEVNSDIWHKLTQMFTWLKPGGTNRERLINAIWGAKGIPALITDVTGNVMNTGTLSGKIDAAKGLSRQDAQVEAQKQDSGGLLGAVEEELRIYKTSLDKMNMLKGDVESQIGGMMSKTQALPTAPEKPPVKPEENPVSALKAAADQIISAKF